MKTVTECIVCLFRPMLYLGSICGSSVMSFKCPHSSNPSKVPQGHKSIISLTISTVFYVSTIIDAIFYCYKIYISTPDQHIQTLFLLYKLLFCLGSVNFAFTGTVNYKDRILEFNGITAIIENRHYYGFSSIIDRKTVRYFLRRRHVAMAVTIWGVLHQILFAIRSPYANTNRLTSLFNTITSIMYHICHCMSVFQFMLASCLYTVLFKKCLRQIIMSLSKRLEVYKKTKLILVEIPEEIPLEEQLRRLRYMYISLVYNYRQLNKFLHPTILIWWTILIIQMICTFYMISIFYSTDSDSDIFVMMGSYVSTVFIVYFLNIAEKLNIVNEEVLSFLFKYPISKLSLGEITQVEMLTRALAIQKPVLKASDIFTVGTRLLGSISGTIVTYVLVALQFRASWKRNNIKTTTN